MSFFDENYFHCRLVSKGVNTELIRLQSQVKESTFILTKRDSHWTKSNASGSSKIRKISSRLRKSLRITINPALMM